jgi:osmotically-inducible protein OsmY
MSRARAFLAGAAVAYLVDPAHGRRRRHQLRDRGARVLRRARRLVGKRARFALGHVHGLAAKARGAVTRPERATDDRTVEQRIRSDALRGAGVASSNVDVHVEQGVAILRGSVPEPGPADDLVERVGKVPGVVDVSDQLEVEGGRRGDQERIAVT